MVLMTEGGGGDSYGGYTNAPLKREYESEYNILRPINWKLNRKVYVEDGCTTEFNTYKKWLLCNCKFRCKLEEDYIQDTCFVWFSCDDDATLFKLTWG